MECQDRYAAIPHGAEPPLRPTLKLQPNQRNPVSGGRLRCMAHSRHCRKNEREFHNRCHGTLPIRSEKMMAPSRGMADCYPSSVCFASALNVARIIAVRALLALSSSVSSQMIVAKWFASKCGLDLDHAEAWHV